MTRSEVEEAYNRHKLRFPQSRLRINFRVADEFLATHGGSDADVRNAIQESILDVYLMEMEAEVLIFEKGVNWKDAGKRVRASRRHGGK